MDGFHAEEVDCGEGRGFGAGAGVGHGCLLRAEEGKFLEHFDD